MLKLRNEKRNYEISVPTKFSEINFEDVKAVLENVTIAEHYAVVALCQSFSPFNLAMLGAKSPKDVNVPVSMNFIKANDPNNKLSSANCGDKVLVSRADIERSVHLPINFGLSTSSLAATISDNQKVLEALRNGPVDENGKSIKELIVIEFKLVPIVDIKAVINRDITIKDVYRSTIQGS